MSFAMTRQRFLLAWLILGAVLATASLVYAHPGGHGSRLLAQQDAGTIGSDRKEQPAAGKVTNVDRQLAYFDFELLTHLALHAPTPLQEQLIEVGYADHCLVMRNGSAKDLSRLEPRRAALHRKLRHEYHVIQMAWTPDGPELNAPQAVPLASGLTRQVLLEIDNQTDQVVDITAKQQADVDAPDKKYTIHPGSKQFVPAAIRAEAPGSGSIRIELVDQLDGGESQSLDLPVEVQEPATLKAKLLEPGSDSAVPGRVFVLGSDGLYRHDTSIGDQDTLYKKQLLKFYELRIFYKLPFFYSDGTVELKVPPGKTTVTLERGFEHAPVANTVDLKPGEVREIEITSGRVVDMRERGWVSGDTHIHWVTNAWNIDMPLDMLATVQRAEDLRVANNLTLLQRGPSLAFINPAQAPMGTVEDFSDEHYHIEMGEEYRNEDLYGHLCFLNLDWLVQPIGTGGIIAGPDALDYPHNKTAILACREQGGISCEAHGLGGNKDVPVNIVHGLTDSLDQMPPLDYYDFLECGFHLPLTNGSDHPARVAGCARAYVKVDGDFTYEKWIEGIRQCRTFTTSGPLLFLNVNEADIGDTVRASSDDTLSIRAEVVSRYPVGVLQVVSNGEVIAEKRIPGTRGTIELSLPADQPRWVIARCGPDDSFNALDGPGIAHTSAVYVEVDGRERFVAGRAERWISEMRRHIGDIQSKGRFANDAQMEEAIEYVEEGIRRYQELISESESVTTGTARPSASPMRLVSSRSQKPKKIVLIPTELDHAWATHMYRLGCELLAACLNQNPGVEAIVSPDFDWPSDPEVLEGVDAIVYYSRPAADIVLAPNRRKQFKELMDAGVGFTAIHWATGTADKRFGPEYLDLLGGWFDFGHSGLAVDKAVLEQVEPNHPICNGWKSYELRDEFYLDLRFSDQAVPVLKVNVQGKNQTVAWAQERPNSRGGRSFGTTLAHFHDNFFVPAFRRAIVNGILWTAHAAVPEGGANVDLDEALQQIPPDPAQAEAQEGPAWPIVSEVESQPLLLQVKRLAEALDFIGNPLSDDVRAGLAGLKQETDERKIAAKVQELLDPLCVAAVVLGDDTLQAVGAGKKPELVENGWRSYLIKVDNRGGLTNRLRVESPNARSMPHAKQQDVASRWMGLSLFEGRPLQANLSGLELEYRIVQLYSRDRGERNAALEFAIDRKSGSLGRQIREWRFDNGPDGWEALNNTNIESRDNSLFITSKGDDPFIGAEVGDATGDMVLRFWAESEQDGVGQLFWWTEERPAPDENRCLTFPLIPGGAHLYELPFSVNGVLAGVRIDPNVKPFETRIDWIDLSYAHRRGETWDSLPMSFDCKPAVPVTLKLTDKPGEPVVVALDVRDELGRVYPEQSKRLAPDLFFHPQIYRQDGEKLFLPPGEYRVKCWRGPHSVPETKTLVVGESPTTLEYAVDRWIDTTEHGWWPGDHHIHAAGCLHYVNPTQGILPSDMLRQTMGEDLNVGCCLNWGPCFDYQKQFFTGRVDDVSDYPYFVRYDVEVSGFGSHASGHLNLLRLREQIPPGGDSKLHWPTLGLNTLRWAKSQGAICGPAHSGNGLTNYVGRVGDYKDGPQGLPHFNLPAFDGIGANEYIVDVTHEVPGPDGELIPAIDFISAMNTPRSDEWNMWYHTLNCGFRVRISGETDFPCMSGERVGIGRVYVKLDGRLNFADWVQGIQDGRSYVSDGLGHILDFEARPAGEDAFLAVGEAGSEIALDSPRQVEVRARAALRLANAADGETVKVELVANGYPLAETEIPADGTLQDIRMSAAIDKSSWIALRVFPHVHTNPFFIEVAGEPIRASRGSAEWCLDSVEQCWLEKHGTYDLDEQEDARKAYEHARRVYRQILDECEE